MPWHEAVLSVCFISAAAGGGTNCAAKDGLSLPAFGPGGGGVLLAP
jgi:hypothetical protein